MPPSSYLSEIDDDSVVCSSKKDDTLENRSTTGDSTRSSRSEEELAGQETRNVARLRAIVLLVLLTTSIIVSLIIYLFTRQAQVNEFKIQFDDTADIVLDRFISIMTQYLGSVATLGIAATAQEVDHSTFWPMVTISSWAERSAAARELSNGLYIEFAPYVSGNVRKKWEMYSLIDEGDWIRKAVTYKLDKAALFDSGRHIHEFFSLNITIDEFIAQNDFNKAEIFNRNDDYEPVVDDGEGPYLPVWQISPVSPGKVNENIFGDKERIREATSCLQSGAVVVGDMHVAPKGDIDDENLKTKFYAWVLSNYYKHPVEYHGDPMTSIYIPIFDSFEIENRTTAAVISVLINWGLYFEKLLPANSEPITIVLENSCDGNVKTSYTYNINGNNVDRIGGGFLNDPRFTHLERSRSYRNLTNIADGTMHGLKINQQEGECVYKIHVYPTLELYKHYVTREPIVLTVAVFGVFFFSLFTFICYDRLVQKRQNIVLRTAEQSTAIVSSIFPKNVRDRIMEGAAETTDKKGQYLASNQKIKSFLNGGSDEQLGTQQIADLFPHATVFFADIAGFTAWSSTREPEQVFVLLQTIYQNFDDIALKRKVFKVETVGDSYVAVTGLPEPQEYHATIMAKFAFDIIENVHVTVKELEKTLGPDTGDLSMRIGLHSGPVTAGVLRGQNCRFQIFGDTVNTAARMESTGARGKIQISQTTADLLRKDGKGHWITAREDSVLAKGKGVLNTFWLVFKGRKGRKGSMSASSVSSTSSDTDHNEEKINDSIAQVKNLKQERLVDWIADTLKDHVKQVIIKRKATGNKLSNGSVIKPVRGNQIPIDEVVEAIFLPTFDQDVASRANSQYAETVQISKEVEDQLRAYVATIASTYRDNPFHNFEHACHVTMSVQKFLKRIVKPDLQINDNNKVAAELHNYTHGINSDPLTMFAIVFSALIHDVDHRGVSNAQLIKEDERMANVFRGKSVAEQNSLTIAWDLLMSGDYDILLNCLFADQSEVLRFRQIVVNIILATDIFDKDYNELRKARWEKAFGESTKADTGCDNLRATVVMEHIIQASDVSHTMQHWHIYQKWNKCLLKEMYQAYQAGRLASDPSKFWYKGELSFFDNYIIPLAKKLKDCNVFGVSSDECLNYAKLNRAEWEEKGAKIVEDEIAKIKKTSEHA